MQLDVRRLRRFLSARIDGERIDGIVGFDADTLRVAIDDRHYLRFGELFGEPRDEQAQQNGKHRSEERIPHIADAEYGRTPV